MTNKATSLHEMINSEMEKEPRVTFGKIGSGKETAMKVVVSFINSENPSEKSAGGND